MMWGKTSEVRNLTGIVMILTLLLCSCMAFCPTEEDGIVPEVNQIVGKWFPVAAVPPNKGGPADCSRVEIASSSPDNFTIHFEGISGNPPRKVAFNANVTISNMMGVWNLVGVQRLIGPLQHRFLAIADGHLVLFICGSNQNKIPSPEHALILSRFQMLGWRNLRKMTELLAEYVDRNMILDVKQSTCSL